MAKVDWNALEQDFKKRSPSGDVAPPIAGDAWEVQLERARIRAKELETLGFTQDRLGGIETPGYESIDPKTGQQHTSPPPPEAGLFGALKARILGTDVPHDPAILSRLATTIGSSVAGGLGANRLLRPAGKALQSLPYAPAKALGVALPHIGSYLGSGLSAGVGSRLPEDMTSLMEYAGMVPKGTREKYLLNDDELKIVMRGEIIADMALGGGISAIKHTYRTASRLLQLAGRSSQELAATAKELGIEIPGTASAGSFFERVWTPVFARIPLWGGPITGRAKLSSKQMIDVLNMKIMGPIVSDTEAGRRLFEGAAETVRAFNKRFSDQYTAVWARADELGVMINPTPLREEAQDILAEIAQRSVRQKKEAPGDKALRKFIMEKIISNKSVLSGQEATMTQIDGFLKDMFQTKTMMAKKGRHADTIFERLRQAAIANTVDEASLFSKTGADSGAVKVVTEDLKALNAKFGREVRALFETTGALKFGRFQKGGIRSITSPQATTSAVDEVAKAFKDSDSPQVMRELKSLMPPEVFDEFIELRLKQAYEAAVKVTTKEGEEFQVFNPAAFREKLGLNSPGSAKYEVTEFLLGSSSRLPMKDLNTFLKAAEEIQRMDVPNPYAMAQRRAGLGGVAAAVGAFTVGSGITGYAGHAVTGGSILGAAVGAILAVLPARGISNLLANPRAAIPIKNMISESATNTRKLKSVLQLVRLSVTAGIEEGEITREVGEEFYHQMRAAVNEGTKTWKDRGEPKQREPLPMGISPYDDIKVPVPYSPPAMPPDTLSLRPEFQNPNRVIPPARPPVQVSDPLAGQLRPDFQSDIRRRGRQQNFPRLVNEVARRNLNPLTGL